MTKYNNPFSFTKASDFSDEDINKYWVNIFPGNIDKVFNPMEPTPKYILGSKGCGKTHLLRHFSFPVQLIRNKTIRNIIKNDKFIGVYTLFSSLESSRFEILSKKGEFIFRYYFELFICQKLINIYLKIFEELKVNKTIENTICIKIKDIFLNNNELNFESLKNFYKILKDKRKKIDYEINNSIFTDNINISIEFNPGDLIYNIPNIIASHIDELKDIKILYILDELEKLREKQKEFINTLVWERTGPITIWIGARYYGFTTFVTNSGEEIRAGSEYEPIELDDILMEKSKETNGFLKKILKKRLELANCHWLENLEELFEEVNDDNILRNINTKKHKNKFLSVLKKNGINNETAEKIADFLADDNILYEKYNLYLFYQDWSSLKKSDGTVFLDIAECIKNELKEYKNDKINRHAELNEKRKADIIFQLFEENRKNNYTGLKNILEIANLNPRTFLTILKNIYKWSLYNDEFSKNENIKFSADSQNKGVIETSEWFYNNCELKEEKGISAYKSIEKLAELLRRYRLSAKPTECSVSSIIISKRDIEPIEKEVIDNLIQHSVLIKLKDRVGKNKSEIKYHYQINKSLSPKWNLPIARRGVIELKGERLKAVFNSKYENYEKIFNEFLSQYNPPFNPEEKSEETIIESKKTSQLNLRLI
jgi:hypothetical protein